MKIKILLVVSMLIVSTSLKAATIVFAGTLGFIEVDNGSSFHSDFSVGDNFFGHFVIGDSSSDAGSIDIIAPTAIGYNFIGAPPYSAAIIDDLVTSITVGVGTSVGIGDNDGMGDDTFFLNNLYGTVIPYETISDTWDVSSSNGFNSFGLILYSLDTGAFSGLDYQILPYALEQADYAMFYIEDTDSTGTTYLATGFLTSVTVVPIPPAVWLFGSGLIGLIGIARRKKA